MALRTRDDYLKSLRGLKPNVYKFGRLIEDVTTDPTTRRVVESQVYRVLSLLFFHHSLIEETISQHTQPETSYLSLTHD